MQPVKDTIQRETSAIDVKEPIRTASAVEIWLLFLRTCGLVVLSSNVDDAGLVISAPQRSRRGTEISFLRQWNRSFAAAFVAHSTETVSHITTINRFSGGAAEGIISAVTPANTTSKAKMQNKNILQWSQARKNLR